MSDARPPAVVVFICPHCGRLLRAATAMIGRRSACPFCDRPVLVTAASAIDWGESPTWVNLPGLPDDG